uniref:Uncharacterized protein n=1 Tax=Romanomermis culicivorax TaxID=13658 RepID=A0A915KI93_ROMCU
MTKIVRKAKIHEFVCNRAADPRHQSRQFSLDHLAPKRYSTAETITVENVEIGIKLLGDTKPMPNFYFEDFVGNKDMAPAPFDVGLNFEEIYLFFQIQRQSEDSVGSHDPARTKVLERKVKEGLGLIVVSPNETSTKIDSICQVEHLYSFPIGINDLNVEMAEFFHEKRNCTSDKRSWQNDK